MEWYVGSEWKLDRKGLCKHVLALDFTEVQKPHQVSKVLVRIDEVQNLDGRATKYLSAEYLSVQQQIEMGTALTPVDCYVELMVREMIVGEKALCSIRTQKEGNEICFVVTLEKILESREIHKLSVNEMYTLALRYKENGVVMFKEYPTFAHEYFVRAAKCLISYKPFEGLTLEQDGIKGTELQALFVQIQTNLAACLLTQKRYEDVIYQTQFVDTMAQPTEKSIYRRATAYYHLKEFEKAQKTIEKVPNYQEKKDFIKLHQRIVESRKTSNDNYKHVMQRMFN